MCSTSTRHINYETVLHEAFSVDKSSHSQVPIDEIDATPSEVDPIFQTTLRANFLMANVLMITEIQNCNGCSYF